MSLPATVESLLRKIKAAGLRFHLFDCTNDYRVPVMSAMLLDRTGNLTSTSFKAERTERFFNSQEVEAPSSW